MKKSIGRLLKSVFLTMFLAGILIGLVGAGLCVHDNSDYDAILPEVFVIEEIECVIGDGKRLYVCYGGASCVNTYSEEGVFLWAVSTPYLRNSYFEINKEGLVIYNGKDAYVYDERTGVFRYKTDSKNMDLAFEREKSPAVSLTEGDFCYDAYTVYRVGAGGALDVFIARPGWIRFFYAPLWFAIAFSGGLGIIVLEFGNRICKRKMIQANVKNKTAKKLKKYWQITTVIHLVYAAVCVIVSFWGGWLCIGIIPITLHLIIAGGATTCRCRSLQLSADDEGILDMWEACLVLSFVAAFLSVIVAVAIAS